MRKGNQTDRSGFTWVHIFWVKKGRGLARMAAFFLFSETKVVHIQKHKAFRPGPPYAAGFGSITMTSQI